MNWENYIRETAGQYKCLILCSMVHYLTYNLAYIYVGGRPTSDGGPSLLTVNLPQILAFVTGADAIPPMEFPADPGADAIPPMRFPADPVITFSKDKSRLLPLSSTCSLSLTLSTALVEYDMFRKNMDMAVLNAYELVKCSKHFKQASLVKCRLVPKPRHTSVKNKWPGSYCLRMHEISKRGEG